MHVSAGHPGISDLNSDDSLQEDAELHIHQVSYSICDGFTTEWSKGESSLACKSLLQSTCSLKGGGRELTMKTCIIQFDASMPLSVLPVCFYMYMYIYVSV